MKLFCKKCSNIFSVDPGSSVTVQCPRCKTDISCPEEELGVGSVIGGFVIEQRLNAGGMGIVFAARQISLDRPVALKVLMKEFTDDSEYVDSLFREARAAAQINHPNIVQAYDVGKDGGYHYFAMELVRGDTLKNILRNEGAVPPERAASIIRDIANALDVAWREQKLVHQDIKPDNIMIDINGVPKLADLGLAKTATLGENNDNSEEVLGTPQYISPEQLTGVPTDIRSDIYSLGATFYHIVTGKLPYRASDFVELAKMHDAGNLVPPKEIFPGLPDELNRIIVKMMARNINERYQDSASLANDLTAFLNGSSLKKDHDLKSGKAGEVVSISPVAAAPRPAMPAPGGVNPAAPRPAALRPAMPGPAAPRPVAPAPGGVNPAVPRPAMPVPGGVNPAAPRPAVPVPGGVNPAAPRPVAPVPGVPAGYTPAGGKSGNMSGIKIAMLVLLPFLLVALGIGVLALTQKDRKSPVAQEVVEEESELDAAAKESVPTETSESEEAVSYEKPKEEPVTVEIPAEVEITSDEQKSDSTTDETTFDEPETPQPQVVPVQRRKVATSESTFSTFKVMDLSRDEYIRRATELLEWRNANQGADEQFLQKVDQQWAYLCIPETERELKLFQQIAVTFSSIDEQYRCIDLRQKLRQEHLALAAQDLARENEQKEIDRQREIARQKMQQEIDAKNQDNKRLQQEDEQRVRQRAATIKGEIDLLTVECVKAMRISAISGDNKPLEKALLNARTFINNQKTFSTSDAKAISNFKALLPKLVEEQKVMHRNFRRMLATNEKRNVNILLEYGTGLLCKVTPGELTLSVGNKMQTLKYDQALPRTRTTLFQVFEKRAGVKNAEFYSDILHNKRPQDKVVPKGVWKTIWPVVKDSFK